MSQLSPVELRIHRTPMLLTLEVRRHQRIDHPGQKDCFMFATLIFVAQVSFVSPYWPVNCWVEVLSPSVVECCSCPS